MAERFKEPRICAQCKNSFIGRDKAGVIARFCSRKCHFASIRTPEKQRSAGKIAGTINIIKLRGTGKKGYIKEYGRHQHRVIVEKHIGRKLKSDEIIHHVDENKHNNDINNLKIVTRSEHARIHFTKTTTTPTKSS